MSQGVRFTYIKVEKMPGFPNGGLSVKDLAPGVNVIYGPNASGKTTLVRAMKGLLGSHDEEHHAECVAAGLDWGGKSYEIVNTFGHVECRSGGAKCEIPQPVRHAVQAARKRYVLGLHDLIQREDEHDIVGDIVREAAGGYELKKAAEKLGFGRDQPRRRTKACDEYDTAKCDRQTAEDGLARITEEEQRLADLIREQNELDDAESRRHVLELALKAKDKSDTWDAASKRFDAFPNALTDPGLTGEEWKRLTKIKEDMAELRGKFADETRSIREAEHKIDETRLSGGTVGDVADGLHDVVSTLLKRWETLGQNANEISRLQREVQGDEARLRKLLAGLGGVSISQFDKLDDHELDDLFKFVEESERLRAHEQVDDLLEKWLAKCVPPFEWPPDLFSKGIDLLQRWLAEQHITRTREIGRRGWVVVAALCAVFSLAMTFVHSSWLILLLLAIALATWATWARPPVPASVAHEIQAKWSTLGFQPLAAWTEEEVKTQLGVLQGWWCCASLYQHRKSHFAQFEDERAKHRDIRTRLNGTGVRWRNASGTVARARRRADWCGCEYVAANSKISRRKRIRRPEDVVLPYGLGRFHAGAKARQMGNNGWG